MDRFGKHLLGKRADLPQSRRRRDGPLREGQTIVCTGFGGGLTYGAFVLKL